MVDRRLPEGFRVTEPLFIRDDTLLMMEAGELSGLALAAARAEHERRCNAEGVFPWPEETSPDDPKATAIALRAAKRLTIWRAVVAGF